MTKYLFLCIYLLLQITCNAQNNPQKILLWENGAPGFEHKKDEPEHAKDWWVKNVHNPSITIFKPEMPNGGIILICPGGGHKDLVFDEEGTKAAKFLNTLGFTTAVLKYRLFRESNSPYNFTHPKQDIIRAMKLLSYHADQWGLDKNNIGIMGFSAGGELVNSAAFEKKKNTSSIQDIISKEKVKPNFLIQIYPGPLGIPKKVSSDAPPLFLLASNNDACCSVTILNLLMAYRKAGADVEAHFYSKGDHGFNMGDRSPYQSINQWPQRLKDWLIDNQYFQDIK